MFVSLKRIGVGAAGMALAAGLAVGAASTAGAQTREIKMAFFASPKHHVWAKMMMPWAEQIEAATDGLKIVGFPGGQIGGSPPGAFKRVVNGISDVEFSMQGYTSTVFPKTMVIEIPMQWKTPSDATRAMWRIFDEHLKSEYKRVKVLALWGNDTPVLMTNKVVRTPADLEGLKLRTPSRDQAEIIKGLGAIPVAMPMPATYNAIEKGVVDGALVGISVVNSFKLAEVVKNYVLGLPMGYSPQMISMHEETYESLTPDQKKAIDAHSGLELSLLGSKLYEEARAAGIKTVKERPDTQIIELTAEERAKWNERFKKIVADWVERHEKAGIKNYRELLADYLAKPS